MTDNKNRTVSEIRRAFSKFGGNLGESGCVSWNFDRKGRISFSSEGVNEDDFFEKAIELGAEDINNSDGNIWVSVDESSSKIYVERKGTHTVGPLSEIRETHYYTGDENNLVFEAEYENKFHCSYDLHCFPFDTQVCGMEVFEMKYIH